MSFHWNNNNKGVLLWKNGAKRCWEEKTESNDRPDSAIWTRSLRRARGAVTGLPAERGR